MPARRTLLVTALPVAILGVFAVIGIVASGSDDGARAPEGHAFASEPVKARWERGSAASARFTFEIESPVAEQATGGNLVAESLAREGLCLDGWHDVIINHLRLESPPIGLLVNSGSQPARIIIDDLTSGACTEYGGYISDVSDCWVRNSTLQQAKDATQHGLRIASCNRLRISDSIIDSRLGDKTSLWIMHGDQIEMRNVKIVGGRNWFSTNPENPELPQGRVSNVVIADCWIDLDEDQDWSHALEFMPGVDGVTITNLHVRSAKPPIGLWTSVGDVPGPRNVRWKDIWIPAPGQPRDKPFDDLEWVKLRDDDWERIIGGEVGGGRTRAELIAAGVGPLP